jgi:hypothetical protein
VKLVLLEGRRSTPASDVAFIIKPLLILEKEPLLGVVEGTVPFMPSDFVLGRRLAGGDGEKVKRFLFLSRGTHSYPSLAHGVHISPGTSSISQRTFFLWHMTQAFNVRRARPSLFAGIPEERGSYPQAIAANEYDGLMFGECSGYRCGETDGNAGFRPQAKDGAQGRIRADRSFKEKVIDS